MRIAMRGLPILLAALLAASSYAGDAPVDDRDHFIDGYRLCEEVSVLAEVKSSLLDEGPHSLNGVGINHYLFRTRADDLRVSHVAVNQLNRLGA